MCRSVLPMLWGIKEAESQAEAPSSDSGVVSLVAKRPMYSGIVTRNDLGF